MKCGSQADPGICWMGCMATAAGLNGWQSYGCIFVRLHICMYRLHTVLRFRVEIAHLRMIFGEDRCAAWTQWLQSTLSKGGVKVCSSVPPVTLCFAFDKRSLSFASFGQQSSTFALVCVLWSLDLEFETLAYEAMLLN